MSETIAAVFLGAVVLGGLVLLRWGRPWHVLDRIETDDEGRPTDEFSLAQVWHDFGGAAREFLAVGLEPWLRKNDQEEGTTVETHRNVRSSTEGIEHELTMDCVCGPDVEWFDPETGEAHESPLVTHHSLDGRELREDGR